MVQMDVALLGRVLPGVPDCRGPVDGGVVRHDYARARAVFGEVYDRNPGRSALAPVWGTAH